MVATTRVTRTVEGDLGMRWSAVTTAEAAGRDDLAAAAVRRHDDVGFVPDDDAECALDEEIARAAVGLALRRHAGRSKVVVSPEGRVVERTGKDLREVDLLVGSGGVLRHGRPGVARRVFAGSVGEVDGGLAAASSGRGRRRHRLRPRCRGAAGAGAPLMRRSSGRVRAWRRLRPPRVTSVSNDARPETPAESRARERLTQRLAHQWANVRSERRTELEPVATGPSNLRPAKVPYGVDLVAQWAWRLLLIGFASYVLFRMVQFFAELTIPVVVALLISALASPLVGWLQRIGIPRGFAAFLVVLGGLALVASMLGFAGQQVAAGANDLANQVSAGLNEIKDWLRTGPLHVSDQQINDYIQKASDSLQSQAKSGKVLSQVTGIGSALTHILAGLFLVLFSTYFFLADGDRIWSWIVRIAPRAARAHVDSSGRVAWVSLTQFVRATVIVAITDAVGVMIAASILQVQFVLAIGVIVFLGAFVPIVGAFVAGTVAVLVALVDHGPVVALLMLGAVVLVQQIESHVLQPFLMGRFVSIHPLGIIIAIAAGILLAGVAGALVAVPFAAAANAVVQHLATQTTVGEDPDEALEDDYAQTGDPPRAGVHDADPEDDGRVGDTDDAGPADQYDPPRGDVEPADEEGGDG